MTLIGIQLVYADFHTATANKYDYYLHTIFLKIKTYTIHSIFDGKNYILYNYIAYVRNFVYKHQKIPRLFDIVQSTFNKRSQLSI